MYSLINLRGTCERMKDIKTCGLINEDRQEKEKTKWIFQDEAERNDLRYLDVCSVDPIGCTDIDDALHCRKLPNGNFEVSLFCFNYKPYVSFLISLLLLLYTVIVID